MNQSDPQAGVPLTRLGRSGLHVSRIALGTMMFGDRTDREEAARIVDDARERGVNMIDTANAYSHGRSETITGELIAADRDRWILSTKAGMAMGEGPNERGVSRRHLERATAASLGRLGTDVIDVLYLHKEDHGTPLEETVRAVADLIRSGRIRYFGVSNYRAWRVARICDLCDQEGIDRPVVAQVYYHALYRAAELELLPACAALGVGVMGYSPLARGVLTGKYVPGAEPPADSRAAAGNRRMLATEYHPENIAAAARLREHVEGRGGALAPFAVAWALANPLVHGIVAGPRTLAQWQGYFAGLDHAPDADDESAVDALVPPGTSAIAQYVDPSYPPEGRPRAP
ncbi:aldo/keto reductase [Spiribacter halobius]|uniref:NADP-dependent oxidoreductase n=1 Tax=Sediminicurvatus halobius TaxID=2182432 RepID=A0A2U2N5H3_9GAMM|nr:aldo/keto reductase [Spiribacter halobius]PWG64380.1 NADP-dependent oxidoreductase [Spiribacter halobius]UEX79272.1 aldo/keto reductase [Spiribacter halobius]